jgi:hypothetical protein
MNLRQTPWVVGIATVAALIGRGPSQPEPARETAPPAAAIALGAAAPKEIGKSGTAAGRAAARRASRRRYARLYREFLGIEVPAPQAPRSQGTLAARLRGTLAAQPLRIDLSPQAEERTIRDQDLLEIARAARVHGYGPLEFMVVLVADPIDSGLVSEFDLAMIAVQRALADAGYRHDRQWLPWVEPEAAEAKEFRKSAGLMLFRRQSDCRQPPAEDCRHLLAVFLVGETAKLGIHKQAFLEAVNFILDLNRADQKARPGAPRARSRPRHPRGKAAPPPAPRREVPVLGPTFSGSVESLRIALREVIGRQDVSFRIVSGSASEPAIEPRLREGDLAQRVRFERTVIADDELAEKGLSFLQDRLGWDLDHAALLVERDTAYGSYFATEQQSLLARITKLTFPSGLFALRNAWEQTSGAAAPSAAEGAGGPQATAVPKTELEVSLADQRTPVDVVPEQSPVSSRIADMGVANLLRQVSREGYHYVGILATDIKDQLFLAEQVRRWAPNVILFVVDNNLLYVHPQYNATMFGTLTISSYPLITEPAPLSVPPILPAKRLRQQFFSERQEGIYFAARSLVCKVRPPQAVWIAASGHYGIWPLGRMAVGPVRPGAARSGKGARPPAVSTPVAWIGPAPDVESIEPAQPAPEAPPDGAGLMLVLLFAVLCVVSLLLRREALGFSRAVNQPRVLWLMRAAAGLPVLAGAGILGLWIGWLGASHAGWTRWLGLSSFGWIVQAESLHARWSAWMGPSDSGCAAWLGLLLMLAAYGFLLYLFVEAAGPYPRRWWASLAFIPFAVIGLLLPGLTLFLLWYWGQGDTRLLLFRAGALTGGLSPMVPLAWLSAAVFFWVVTELKRQLIRERDKTGWPLQNRREAPLKFSGNEAADLAKRFDHTLPSHEGLLGAAVVVAPLAFLWSSMQPVGESRHYGIAFLIAAAVIGFLVLTPFFCAVRAWFLVRRLVRRIAQTPLLEALKRVRAEVDWKPLHFGWDTPELSGLRRSVERLHALLPQQPRLPRRELRLLLAKITYLADRKRRVAANVKLVSYDLDQRRRLNEHFQEAYAKLAGLDHPVIDDFFAVRLIVYFQQVFAQLRYWLMASMGTGLLLIAGIAIYAFEPKRFTMLVAWGVLSLVSAWTLVIFVQMSRDPTLSAIGGTDPGKITYDWPFVSNVLAYGVVPVLGLIASQFPSLGRLIGGLLDPLARLLRIN